MRLTTKIVKKSFTGKSERDAFKRMMAYLFKYFFKHGLARSRADSITFYIDKSKSAPTITLEINAEVEFNDVKKEHCRSCEFAQTLPWFGGRRDCDDCPLVHLEKRANKKLTIRSAYLGERLRYYISQYKNSIDES